MQGHTYLLWPLPTVIPRGTVSGQILVPPALGQLTPHCSCPPVVSSPSMSSEAKAGTMRWASGLGFSLRGRPGAGLLVGGEGVAGGHLCGAGWLSGHREVYSSPSEGGAGFVSQRSLDVPPTSPAISQLRPTRPPSLSSNAPSSFLPEELCPRCARHWVPCPSLDMAGAISPFSRKANMVPWERPPTHLIQSRCPLPHPSVYCLL